VSGKALRVLLTVLGVVAIVTGLSAGPPHPLFAILTVAELAGPPLLVAWQARLAR
jgi:hypothetical protein